MDTNIKFAIVLVAGMLAGFFASAAFAPAPLGGQCDLPLAGAADSARGTANTGNANAAGSQLPSAKGSASAPVEIIEFSDFECPFCAKFYYETLPQVEREYISTGKVKFEYRHFPLYFHPNAQKAAEASECAGDQGKFWEMHDLLYENQDRLDVGSLKAYASSLGLDTAAFNTCLDSGAKAQKVRDDLSAGEAAGVSGTPTFLINGKPVVGAQPYSVFRQAIEQELAG